jgi:endonuclease/exonuclease/phosphatase family metal-dependent hydrolase
VAVRTTGSYKTLRAKTLRVVTLNLWGDNGPWADRLALVGDELAALTPDVVTLQEVRDVPGRVPNQAAVLAERLGFRYVFAESTAWGGGREGLAVVSRFPIGEHEARPLPHSTETEGRIVLSARIDTDDGQIWVHTTHLSFRESEGANREDQVLFVDEVVTAHKNDNIQIVTGDFNASPPYDEIRWMTGLCTLGGRRVAYQDAWERLYPGLPGLTWASANPYVATMYWLRPDRRLDYVFVTPMRRDRRGTIHAVHVVLDKENAAGIRASDHYGVLADIQIVPEPVPGV